MEEVIGLLEEAVLSLLASITRRRHDSIIVMDKSEPLESSMKRLQLQVSEMTSWDQTGRQVITRRLLHHNAAKLADAAMRRETSTVRELLVSGADPNHADEAGRRPLHAAAFAGAAEVVLELLRARADPNLLEKEEKGDRPLHIASWQGHVEAVKLLLSYGASVNDKDGKGWTPLCIAAKQGRAAVVQVLLSHKAEPGIACIVPDRHQPVTPLQLAVECRNLEVAQVLRNAQSKRSAAAGACCFGNIGSLWRRCGWCFTSKQPDRQRSRSW